MVLFEHIPLDIHIEKARHLPLKDALVYATINPLAYDAVFYVFSHRRELNFASLLDKKQCIDLADAEFLNILHAHVRAESVAGFALPCTFNMFDELEAYFGTQWRVLVNQDSTEVGHPCGNLQFVEYLHYFGLDHDAPEANPKRMAAMCDNLGPYDEYLSRFEPWGIHGMAWHGMYSPAEMYNNRSNIDLSLQYKPCHAMSCL